MGVTWYRCLHAITLCSHFYGIMDLSYRLASNRMGVFNSWSLIDRSLSNLHSDPIYGYLRVICCSVFRNWGYRIRIKTGAIVPIANQGICFHIISLPGWMPKASTRMPFCFAKMHSRVIGFENDILVY
eukprot:sb/3475398/